MQTTAEALRVPLNRTKFQKFRNLNISLTVIGLLMVLPALAGCLYSPYAAVTDTKGRGDWLFIGSMCLWLVVFVGSATITAWQLVSVQTRTLSQNLPALVVDQDGIQDNSSNYTLGRIPWLEIESVIKTSSYSTKLNRTFFALAIVLKDKDMLLRKKSKVVAMWMRPDDSVSKKRQVVIPQGRFEVPVEDLVTQINAFRARVAQ